MDGLDDTGASEPRAPRKSARLTPESRALQDALASLDIDSGLLDRIMESLPEGPDQPAEEGPAAPPPLAPTRAAPAVRPPERSFALQVVGVVVSTFALAATVFVLLQWLSNYRTMFLANDMQRYWVAIRAGLGALGLVILAASRAIAGMDAWLLGRAIHRELRPNRVEMRILQIIGGALVFAALLIGWVN